MTDITGPTPAETPDGPIEGKITITFPQGVHSTGLSMNLSYVDAAQMELAGRFLVRQAESMYAQAAAIQQAKQPGIVIPPPGSIQGLRD